MEPSFGSMIRTEPPPARYSSTAFCSARSAMNWMTESMVRTTW